MIDTVSIKQMQLQHGFLTVGSGKEVILILGSCRVAPYINHFDRWNLENGNRFTIHTMDAFNHNWSLDGERVDYLEALKKLETDDRILNMLKSVDWFIHEWYANAGMFNCNKEAENNIYKYGLQPSLDICIPSFNDLFILTNDILKFNSDLAKIAHQDLNVLGRLSKQTEWEIYQESQKGLDKFHKVCMLSDLPEMSPLFAKNWQHQRFFHSYNHISKYFTISIFELMNEKYLHLPLTKEFMDEISKEDMFANSYTKLTYLDIQHYGLDWGEEIVPIFS